MHAHAIQQPQEGPYASSQYSLSCPSFTYTTTSSATIHGPGYLTGKALRALGKATLRGVDQFIIRRKLMNIGNHFPHTDLNALDRTKGLDAMYDDLLELSRPGFYSFEIRARALRLLVGQITKCQVKLLVEAISRWEPIELQLFIKDLLAQSPPIWILPSSREPKSEVDVSLPTELWPLILFISQVLRISSSACRAVLDAGYLDSLLSMSENKFDMLFASNVPIPAHLQTHVQTACNISFLDIVAYPEFRPMIMNHPIVKVWPQRKRITEIPAPMGYSTFLLEDYEHLYMVDQSPYFELSLSEVCQLKCITTMDTPELLSTMANHVTYKQAFRVHLSRLNQDERVTVFRDMTSHLTSLSETSALYVHLYFTLSRYSELLLFLMLCVERVRSNITYLGALLEAGIEPFLLQILSAEIRFQFPFRVATAEDLALIATDHEILLGNIRHYGLKSVISQNLFAESYALQLLHDVFLTLSRTASEVTSY